MVTPTAFSKLEQEGGRLHGSGKRKHIDAGGAASLQDAGASIRRGSGGDHVVDDDDTLAEKLGAGAKDAKRRRRRSAAAAGESPTWLGVRLTRASRK
jgi:hypothetical protein